ncbi:unnamed protein product [Rangifer tarandus platyrhynchus]|uniref:Uncharacterized protein n=2 Tax=Rangifer tarandus platyrhynchus TaxID=3082113 RepID=A0ACB0F3Z3_RANTA|nr:unnamed protein product [Rangifer tarandus platyrhynchus]CAI9707710.1 unnamed protein product [Rangifer tarandus platyrhynchus]
MECRFLDLNPRLELTQGGPGLRRPCAWDPASQGPAVGGSGLEPPLWCCFCGSTDVGTHVRGQRVASGCERHPAVTAVTPLMATAGLAGLAGSRVSPSCLTAPRAPPRVGIRWERTTFLDRGARLSEV